ncbi:hypothetical protein [Streptomyces sp. CB01881]|uniref:hypothetical protein n=1 Tax=Streptomyces sp. CB01881 TaxID=2078691 RepID=UPI000CDC0BC9|nr:hypothetical protein [Streptomyces sp. CB01881]AUY51451.1 hypothetical protein C2142_23790 [Streptomyces sp. CB01881]TYC74845.1 hypothetical protein EH183_23780 [Streptomyces sp. CB01881]
MTDSLLNVLLGLVASAISAGLGWLGQTVRRRRRLERVRSFLGLPAGTECLLVVNRHASSSSGRSVSRNDVFALMELAALVKECGALADLVAHDDVRQGLGHKAEFCLGGPTSNDRTAAHLTSWLPGVAFTGDMSGSVPVLTLTVGGEAYRYEHESAPSGGQAFVLLARLHPTPGSRPAFLIAGQTAVSNHAAVRHLVAHHRKLARRYGADGTFALVLKVVNPGAYGPDVVELVADVTSQALERRPEAAPAP